MPCNANRHTRPIEVCFGSYAGPERMAYRNVRVGGSNPLTASRGVAQWIEHDKIAIRNTMSGTTILA